MPRRHEDTKKSNQVLVFFVCFVVVFFVIPVVVPAQQPPAATFRATTRLIVQTVSVKDKDGNEVVFSIITNSGNKYRECMATMIQEDLQKIGIHVNVVTLDFPSLIERMNPTFDYEAILLGFTNVGLDPNEQMNVWFSSSENHQWNPSEKTPETAWEAEIDKLMRAQASSADLKKRKESFDRVQEIVAEQAPFIYLMNRNALSAISPNVQGANPVVLVPQTYWNAELLSVKQ